MKKRMMHILSICTMLAVIAGPLQYVNAEGTDAGLRINEVNSSPDDWVELINTGSVEVDLSGYEIRDNSDDHRWKFPAGSTIQPGELLVVDATSVGSIYDDKKDLYTDGTFESAIGIGSGDSIRIYDKNGTMLDSCSWTEHASYNGDPALASIGRYPDGTGDFTLMKETKGQENEVYKPQVVINEIQSNDKNGGADWIELANPSDMDLDISGIVIKDDDDSHGYVIPEGTIIPANGFWVVDDNALGFGLGKADAVRLFDNDTLLQSVSWTSHTNPTLGLYPDVHGTEYKDTKEETPGAKNKFADEPDSIQWPGKDEIKIFDETSMFLEDSSGLDFFNGQLYAVDNGTGTFWILDVKKDGSMSFVDGFESGKRIRFQKDADNAAAAGPDAEGITVDETGMVYIAVERDNSAKGVNFNNILMVDPKADGKDLVALKEWNLTNSLPQVSANMGIEAVEWVANADVDGKLYDQNTKKVFDHSNYPNAVANGVFFVALEDNGHVYAYVLNQDGSVVQIADIDSKLGGAMALDYDTYENVLWVVADNGYGNRSAKITLNGTEEVSITHVLPPSGLNVADNNEGFAIADPAYTIDGQRPVYRFLDGVKSSALSIGSLSCNYTADDSNDSDAGTPPTNHPINDGIDNPDNPGTGSDNKPNGADDNAPAETPAGDDSNTGNADSSVATTSPKTGDSLPVLYAAIGLCAGCVLLAKAKTCRK